MSIWPTLRSQRSRRALVIVAAGLWAVLVSPVPRSLNGAAMLLALGLLAIDIALGAAIGWLPFGREGSLDERQAALRDRAYRVAFRLVAVGVILMVIATVVGAITADHSRPELVPVSGGRWIVGLLQLLLAMPLLVVGWLEPRPNREPGVAARWSLTGVLPVLAVPALAIIWLLAIGTLPVRASAVRTDFMHGSIEGASCGHFVTTREVAYGFGAQLRLDVQPCWDGTHAFIYPGEQYEFLKRCVASPGTADFARISNLKCAEREGADGSLHYTLRATVESGLGGAVSRDVMMELAVTKIGKASLLE